MTVKNPFIMFPYVLERSTLKGLWEYNMKYTTIEEARKGRDDSIDYENETGGNAEFRIVELRVVE